MRIGSRLSFATVSTLALALAACDDPAVQGHQDGASVTPDPNNPEHHEVPAQGTTKAGLEVVDDAIEAWMRATCSGAVGISFGFGGTPLLAKGYGFKDGPPNIVCQDKHGQDRYVGLDYVSPNTPFRIGSNGKAITAAIVRDVIKKRLANLGLEATDEKVESLKIMDEDLNLVSPEFRRAVKGKLAAGGGPLTCAAPKADSKGVPVSEDGRVDPRWLDVTVGHLLSHRSGLPRDANAAYRKMAEIRKLSSPALLDEQEKSSLAPEHAISEIRKLADGEMRFIPAQTLEEYVIANADLCFEFDPGTTPPEEEDKEKDDDGYSNFAFNILEHIAEHVSGKRFAAPLGTRDLHVGSLVDDFNKEKLGFGQGAESTFGLYFSQPAMGQRDEHEPKYRAWRGGSMEGKAWDTKRPFCYWAVYPTGFTNCDLYYVDGYFRFNFDWQHEQVPVSYENVGVAAGAGLLAAEMPLLQRFLAKYWVSGEYGRERATNPSAHTRSHLGGLPGTISTVAQFVGDDIGYTIVPRKDGELDLANLGESTPTASCKLPMGLNLAMAANQSSDSTCGADGCGWRYRALREVVKEALCKVDWMKVNPQIVGN